MGERLVSTSVLMHCTCAATVGPAFGKVPSVARGQWVSWATSIIIDYELRVICRQLCVLFFFRETVQQQMAFLVSAACFMRVSQFSSFRIGCPATEPALVYIYAFCMRVFLLFWDQDV